jgi:hypothetical protein
MMRCVISTPLAASKLRRLPPYSPFHQGTAIMATTNTKSRLSNDDADKKSPNYRAQQTPSGESPLSADQGECHPVKPPGPPSSAAEDHEAANQKCEVNAPQTASKDQREKATG